METTTDTNTGSTRPPQRGKGRLEPTELDLEPLRAFGAAADMPDGPNIRMEEGRVHHPPGCTRPNVEPGEERQV